MSWLVLNIIVTYVFVGTLYTLFMDDLIGRLGSSEQFTNIEKATVILIWPIGLIQFLIGFFKKSK